MNDPKVYDSPQDAPFKVGTRLRYGGDHTSGFENSNGETVWDLTEGECGTVKEINDTKWMARDEDTGERYPIHGWSTVQMDLDPDGKHLRAIDVESMEDWDINTGEQQ